MRRYTELLAALALSTGMALHAQTNEMVIQTKKLGAEIQPTMYGLFFEDINYAADGGLYAELVKNRSFEFPQVLLNAIRIMCVLIIRDMPTSIPDWIMKASSASGLSKVKNTASLCGHVCRTEVQVKRYVWNL